MSLVPTQTHQYYATDLLNRLISAPSYVTAGFDSPALADTADVAADAFANILFGKRITPSDVILMIPRLDWVSGTTYDQYSSYEQTNCIVIASQGSSYNVYKCLQNDGPSTVMPTGSPLISFTTSDGYVWKYLFKIDSTTYSKFTTSDSIPFVEDANTTNSAVHHSVDVVSVVDGGRGYTNYLTGAFGSNALTGNTQQFQLTSTASSIANSYTGNILYISAGSSDAVGEYRMITGYTVNGSTKTISIDSAFNSLPAVNDSYEIYPSIAFTADHGTLPVARAIIDPTSNTVSQVQVLSVGKDLYNVTATVKQSNAANATVVRAASLTPQLSPLYGHGGSVITEAGSVGVGVSVSLDNTPYPVGNQFATVGILTNPNFANVVMAIANNQASQFVIGENFVEYVTVANVGTATITGNTITSNAGFTAIRPGDWLMVNNQMVTQLQSLANVSYGSTKTPAYTTITGPVSLIRLIGSGKITAKTANNITATSTPVYGNTQMFGVTSKVIANVSSVTINGRAANNFLALSGASAVLGTVTGNVAANSVLTQGTAKATVVVANTTSVWLLNQSGSFANGVANSSSGGSVTITDKYSRDITTGDFLYLETTQPIVRQVNKPETVKIVLGTS